MKELLLAVVIILSFNIAAFTWAKSLPTKQSVKIKKERVVKEIKQSLVIIHMPDKSNGSGVIIKSDDFGTLILTAKHVCDGAKKENGYLSEFKYIDFHLIKKHKYEKKKYYGQIIKYAKNMDLCLIHSLSHGFIPAKIAKKVPNHKAKVYNYGNPDSKYGIFTSGYLMQYEWAEDMIMYKISNPIARGSSGSGVFNKNGELIGIVVMFDDSGKHGLAVPLAHVRLFLYGVEH